MKKLVIVAVVLVGLLVAIDFGSAAVAEYQVSKRLRGHLNLQDDPAVRISGFPFLFQAFTGDYRNVEVSADGVTVARLRDIGVEATLHHVRVPFSDLASGSADSVRVDEVIGRARIRAAELGTLIGVKDLAVADATQHDLTLPGQKLPENAVKLSGTTDVTGSPIHVTVIGSLELVGNQVQVTALGVKVDGQTLAPIAEQAILRLFTTRLDPGVLPFTVTPTAVRADNGTLVVEGTARDVVLGTTG